MKTQPRWMQKRAVILADICQKISVSLSQPGQKKKEVFSLHVRLNKGRYLGPGKKLRLSVATLGRLYASWNRSGPEAFLLKYKPGKPRLTIPRAIICLQIKKGLSVKALYEMLVQKGIFTGSCRTLERKISPEEKRAARRVQMMERQRNKIFKQFNVNQQEEGQRDE